MKKLAKYIIGICCSSVLMTGCIEDAVYTQGATNEQLAESSKATEALLWAIPAYANNLETVTSNAYDWGYGSIMHIRDVLTADGVTVPSGYDWYSLWSDITTLGPQWLTTQFVWQYHYKFILTTNNLLSAVDESNANETQLGYIAIAKAFRAMIYLDLARMYEFLENDKTSPVNSDGNNVLNLTVPIVTELTTEEEARNNPRATRQAMYEFILSDLDAAEANIEKSGLSIKTVPNLTAVYGLKARLYMWVENYAKAQEYARLAINSGSYSPVTRSEWLSTTTGFNSLACDAWVWGVQCTENNDVVQSISRNWASWVSNETQFGYTSYGPFFMIDAALYNEINDTDFRKLSFVPPAGSALASQVTYVDDWARSFLRGTPYASLKFRPGNGNTSEFLVGASVAYPLMRIEEMYFIEMEAIAHQNATNGASSLNSFMKQYRDSEYSYTASSSAALINEIITQKRIEFFGEGLSFYDIKRLNMSVIRGYTGTNWDESMAFNTNGRPAWMNFCIVRSEPNNNEGVLGYNNPDPSGLYTPWNAQ